MTCVRISRNGFSVTGHSTTGCEDLEGKLVCSAVSSAAYLVANTITEIIGDKADAAVSDAEMTVKIESVSDKSKALLDGFSLHMQQLCEQYPDRIKVYLEV